MNNLARVSANPFNINEVYRIYKDSKLVAVGTPVELQVVLNERARSLKLKLREWSALPDDIQLENKYQVQLESEYQQELEDCREYLRCLDADYREPFVWPDDLDEYELLFNPNDVALLDRKRRKASVYHRYYRKHLVEQWKKEQKEISEGLTQSIDEMIDSLPAREMAAAIEHKEKMRKPSRANKWTHKLTEVEQNHLDKKKAERQRKLSAMQSEFYR